MAWAVPAGAAPPPCMITVTNPSANLRWVRAMKAFPPFNLDLSKIVKREPKPVQTITGIASYYGGRWIGRKTANGEIYRKADLTAAHKTLPFNTMVRVTNQRNKKSVVLRINNRGPYIKGRILDVSVAAARELQMETSGLAKVTIEVLDKSPTQKKRPSSKLVASTQNRDKAATN